MEALWSKTNIQKLSNLFVSKYDLCEDMDWDRFLKWAGCEVVSVESVFETCELINLRSDLKDFVALGCNNDCELILVPKDFAATAIVLGELPDLN